MLAIIRSGIAAASKEINLISNNIANANTNGFKRSSSQFQDVYGIAGEKRAAAQVGMGTVFDSARRNHAQGAFKTSGSELDLAIAGEGMFMVAPPNAGNELRFTRDGSMRLDENGFIVNSAGHFLIGLDGDPLRLPLRINPDENGAPEDAELLTSVTIGVDGQIKATYAGPMTRGNGSVINRGTIALARFQNEADLTSKGNGQFIMNAKSGPPQIGAASQGNFGDVLSGNLEVSNVKINDELTSMIRAQQAYSASSRMLQADSDIVQKFL